ncbi:MAG TPA: alpha/beta fold hydrolase [Candidatus Binataceae bacterium]
MKNFVRQRLERRAILVRLGVAHWRAFLLLVTLMMLAVAAPTFAAEKAAAPQMLQIAGLEVAAWLPESGTPGPWPIIIFSHGFHGCATQSTFLTDALARSGYAVFAPNHHDAACKNLRAWFNRPAAPFREPKEWNDATYADRAEDVEKLLDALSQDARFRSPPFDWQHVGLVGHSLGGYTVLELGGAWPRFKDPRVKAVLALSPFSTPYIEQQTLRGMDAPVMYQGGTRDIGITPFVKKTGGAYDQTRAPKYFVEFDGAGHFAWTDLRDTYHAEIISYSRAFLDHYLMGKPFPPALTEPHQGVAEVEIKQ